MKITEVISERMKKTCLVLLGLLLVTVFISSALAVTGNIGNARMVLRANVGDTIEKTILVKNINNGSVDIELFASGDLEKDITVVDSKFTLGVGEEKDAKFRIKVRNEGTFESKINVKFYSQTEKQGIGLSSTVIVIASQGDDTDDTDDDIIDDTDDTVIDDTDPYNNSSVIGNNKAKKSISPVTIALSITGIILVIFFVLLIIYYNKNKRNSSEEVVVERRVVERKEETSSKPKKKVKRNEF